LRVFDRLESVPRVTPGRKRIYPGQTASESTQNV
jgi:hypothetical protein